MSVTKFEKLYWDDEDEEQINWNMHAFYNMHLLQTGQWQYDPTQVFEHEELALCDYLEEQVCVDRKDYVLTSLGDYLQGETNWLDIDSFMKDPAFAWRFRILEMLWRVVLPCPAEPRQKDVINWQRLAGKYAATFAIRMGIDPGDVPDSVWEMCKKMGKERTSASTT